jgi:hypothetical protein
MGTNILLQVHSAYKSLYALRGGTAWPQELIDLLDGLAYDIAEGIGFSGECDCASSEECVQLDCTDMSDAINITPSFIEWRNAALIYDFLLEAAQYEDNTNFEDKEYGLDFFKRGIRLMRDGDGPFSNNGDYTTVLQLVTLAREGHPVLFWMASNPDKGGNYSRCLPRAFADEAGARAGLKEYGFRHVDELTTEDLPRLGFPQHETK